MEYVKFADIKPASYNPRKISEVAFEELKGSLKTLGFILPIIVNKDNMTIIAGHQRTKAATAIGMEEAPVFFVTNVDITSEIKFNQVHNGVEHEPEEHAICKAPREPGKFYTDIPVTDFEVKGSMATIVKDMAMLLVKHGDALCAIVCGDEVVFGNNYIKAAQILGIPVHCYFLDKSYKAMFNYYFARDYGVFNYENIEREDFVQGLAQPPRHHNIDFSVLYRRIVKYLFQEDKSTINVLDFGCGKAKFINKLKKECGFNKAIGLEFFNHNKVGICIEKGQEMVTDFIEHVQKHGKFDYTICDAVVNSVNTQKAEDYVFACLNLFTKMGGRIFVSGRSKEFALKIMNAKRNTVESFSVQFYDENGLTAFLKQGQWFFQKFITKEDVDKILERFGFEPFMRYEKNGYWGFGAYKTRELSREEYIEAVNYEFNLKLPNNQSYNRHEEVKRLFNLVDEQPIEGEN